MGQGGGIIGWQFDENWFASYPNSGDHDNNRNVCSCGKNYCAIFYLLSEFYMIYSKMHTKSSVHNIVYNFILWLHYVCRYFNTGDCDSGESCYLTCNNNNCVGYESKCDNVDNCGDNTDEDTCESIITFCTGRKLFICKV